MGYYINPPDMSKEDWLAREGKPVMEPDFAQAAAQHAFPVCLVNNGPFPAAAVASSPEELTDFTRYAGRDKLWYYVDKDALVAVRAIPSRLAT